MPDKLTPLLAALDEILDDDQVAADPSGELYVVHRRDGLTVVVHQAPGGGWAVYSSGSRPDAPGREWLGSHSNRPHDAVFWALR